VLPGSIAPNRDGGITLEVHNAGGAARWHRLLVYAGDNYYFSGATPLNRDERRDEALQRLWAPGRSALVPTVALHIGCDIECCWWDLTRQKRIGKRVQPWVTKQSTALGLPQPLLLSPAEIACDDA
jgi:hypothetical protein